MLHSGSIVTIMNGKGEKLTSADLLGTYPGRLRGLALKNRANVKRPALLYPCGSVHTFFMRFPLDLFFLSKEGVVLRVLRRVPPYRVVAPVERAIAVIEAPSDTFHIPDEYRVVIPGLIEKKP